MALVLSLGITTSALAETFTFVVPQKPGSGTTVWTEIVLKELQRFMPGHTLKLRNFPGARDIPAVNAFQNELRFDNTIIMVSHGGNGVSYLLDKIDYNYFDYELMGSMNNDIVLGKQEGKDEKSGTWTIAGGSGFEPDAAAAAMLV